MSQVAIRCEGLGKQYRLGGQEPYLALRDVVTQAARRRLGRLVGARDASLPTEATLWALHDVNLEVRRGEVLGVIGSNGAGKSTLLKILSRITTPTVGWAETFGHVGSLLEVGTGFHRELTGRENVYLSGAILGMKQHEIAARLDEIVAFAGVERFLDTPVKHYSSGMFLRLGFAVAASLQPDILLVDEVLAVGDAAFQRKCLGRMGEVAESGRTVLCVSHNMVAVEKLCTRVVWLRDGTIVDDGAPAHVIGKYLQDHATLSLDRVWDDRAAAPGNAHVRLRRATVRSLPHAGESLTIRVPFALTFEYENLDPGARLNLSLLLSNEQGVVVLNTAPVHEPVWHGRPFPSGHFRSTCEVPGDLLNDGVHRVDLLVVRDEGVVVWREDNVLVFEVQDAAEMRGGWHGRWPGAVRPPLRWTTEQLHA